MIENLGIKRKQILLKKYKDPQVIFNLQKAELIKNKMIGQNIANNILNKEIMKKVEQDIIYMKENNIDIISIGDENYPESLKQIYDPPISLYIKGNRKVLNSNYKIAIVGCRSCSDYGVKASKYFSYNLAKQNYTIISGLAKGIDTCSHIGTLAAKGKTIAVLGNGLDYIYPKENKELSEEIVENEGAIISEYPLGTKPYKMNFPARNRIISGLSKAIIVIEAKEKSGTLITVDFALEQGRDVFVVPGNINSELSIGTNQLIKQGAKLITNYKDITTEYF